MFEKVVVSYVTMVVPEAQHIKTTFILLRHSSCKVVEGHEVDIGFMQFAPINQVLMCLPDLTHLSGPSDILWGLHSDLSSTGHYY